MLPPGLSTQVTSLRCRDGGFLTWAAKPSVRESPNPAKYCSIQQASPLRLLDLTLRSYELSAQVVPLLVTLFDAGTILPVARASHSSSNSHFLKWACLREDMQGMFC